MELLKRGKKRFGTILLIIAFLILSIIIPFIQSKLKGLDSNYQQNARLLIQAEIISSNARQETNFGNLLAVVATDTTDTLANEAIRYYRNSAKEELINRLTLTYTALYNEVPGQEILKKWGKLSFDELQNEVDKVAKYKTTWFANVKRQINNLTMIIYLLYGFSLIFYSIGLILVNL